MTQSIYPAYPPDLTEEQANFLLTNLKDWSIARGLAVRPAPSFISASQDPSGVLATTAPVTLFPSLFPRHCFDEGFAIQKAYNELYAAIAQDEEWLKSIVEECVSLLLPSFLSSLARQYICRLPMLLVFLTRPTLDVDPLQLQSIMHNYTLCLCNTPLWNRGIEIFLVFSL